MERRKEKGYTKTSKQGFTLIELLVVIAIISVLAAILFPVFARARENARRASCQSNMKQIALGIIMYSQDYDGKLLYYSAIPKESSPSPLTGVIPYIKSEQIFRCPSANLATPNTITSDDVPANATEYGFPAAAGTSPTTIIMGSTAVTLIDSIPQPTLQCLLAETVKASGTYGGKRGFDRFRANDITDTGLVGIMPGFGTVAGTTSTRHFDGNNFAFVDGHVKWLKKETIEMPHATNQAIQFYWP